MLPQRNVANRRVFASDDVRRRKPPVFQQFSRQIGNLPPNRLLPGGSFDSHRPGTSFQVEAAPLGRGVARDAAGRAGSLWGPRRVFLCAEGDLATAGKISLTGNFYLIANQLDSCFGAVYKRDTAKMPYVRQILCSPMIGRSKRRLIFGVRPHECQIGSGEEFRPAVRLRHSIAPSDFLVSANLHSPLKRNHWFCRPPLNPLLIRLRTAPSGTNAIQSVAFWLIFCCCVATSLFRRDLRRSSCARNVLRFSAAYEHDTPHR